MGSWYYLCMVECIKVNDDACAWPGLRLTSGPDRGLKYKMMKVVSLLLGILWLSAVKSHSESSSHTNNWAVLVSDQRNQVH